MKAHGVVRVDEDYDFPLQLPRCLPDDEINVFLAKMMVAFNLPVGLGMIG